MGSSISLYDDFGKVVSDPMDVANTFNVFFSTVGQSVSVTKNATSHTKLDPSWCLNSSILLPTTVDEVEREI